MAAPLIVLFTREQPHNPVAKLSYVGDPNISGKGREPRLAKLDVQFMRALEAGEDTSGVAAQKQAIRDVTRCDMSTLSLEQLGALTLDAALQLPKVSA